MWPFKKKPEPPQRPTDKRVWNDDWQVGDVAECIISQDGWMDRPPWECPPKGARLTVTDIRDGVRTACNTRFYFFTFAEIESEWATQGFRKVRPIAKEQSEIVERILTAKPGADNPREVEPTHED